MPHVYLATPITSVPENQRQIIVRWCHWYIQNELSDKDVFCPAIEYDRGPARGPAQTEADLLAVRDRSWQMFEITDELHVLHPDLSTNAAIEFGFAMGQKLEKSSSSPSPSGAENRSKITPSDSSCTSPTSDLSHTHWPISAPSDTGRR